MPENDESPPESYEPPPPGPLSHFPSPVHLLPALAMFLACYAASALSGGRPEGEYLWLSGDSLFVRHEYWRILTALFAHDGIAHLLANTLILIVFGWMLKAYFGALVFPVISIMIGMASNLATISLYDPSVRLVGASGMGYGMVALWLVLYIRNDVARSLPLRIFRASGFALVMMFPSTFDPRVSYLAHATGFMFGIIAGLALMSLIRPLDPT